MESPLARWALVLSTFSGAALAGLQLLHNRSLWLDEARLVANILSRSHAGLLQPLDANQVAPVGFLLAEKTVTVLFGSSELALRLVPFLCFLAALPVLHAFVVELTGDRVAALLSTAMFALSLGAIYFASEAKQYMGDVFFSLLIPLLALRSVDRGSSSLAALSIVGCVAISMSNVAVVVMATSGAWLAGEGLGRRRNYRIAMVLLGWAAAFGVYYLVFIRQHPARTFMERFWKDAFLPPNPLSPQFYAFLLRSGKDQVQELFHLGSRRLPIATLALTALVDLALRKRFRILFFLLGPLGVHVVLSWMRLYPFYSRFLLYLAPHFTILVSLGTARLVEGVRAAFARHPAARLVEAAWILPVVALLPPLWAGFPIWREEIRRSLAFYARHAQGEPLYVYYAALPAATYYLERGFGQPHGALIPGTRHRDELAAYDPELDNLHGTVWLVFSHVYPFQRGDNEETYMVGYLRQRGGTVLASRRFVGSSIYRVATGR